LLIEVLLTKFFFVTAAINAAATVVVVVAVLVKINYLNNIYSCLFIYIHMFYTAHISFSKAVLVQEKLNCHYYSNNVVKY